MENHINDTVLESAFQALLQDLAEVKEMCGRVMQMSSETLETVKRSTASELGMLSSENADASTASEGMLVGIWRVEYRQAGREETWMLTVEREKGPSFIGWGEEIMEQPEWLFPGFLKMTFNQAASASDHVSTFVIGTVDCSNRQVRFEKRYASGRLNHAVKYEGLLVDDDTIEGAWSMFGQSGSFRATRMTVS